MFVGLRKTAFDVMFGSEAIDRPVSLERLERRSLVIVVSFALHKFVVRFLFEGELATEIVRNNLALE